MGTTMKESDLSEADAIMLASYCYNEVYRKTALRNISKIGMTKTQIAALMSLQVEGAMTMSDLGNRLDIAREQVTRIVNALKEQGLVESVRSEDNRKHVIASITTKGETVLNNHIETSDAILASYLEKFSPADRKALVAHSKAVAAILRKNDFA